MTISLACSVTFTRGNLTSSSHKFNNLAELRSEESKLVQQTALKELNVLHSDFSELKDSTDFNNWLNEQPISISDGIYKNNTDAKWAARVIDLYKADHNLQTKKTTRPNAAEAVTRTKRGSITTEGGKKIWSISEIANSFFRNDF